MKKYFILSLRWAVAFVLIAMSVGIIPDPIGLFSTPEGITTFGFGAAAPYACQKIQVELFDYYRQNIPALRTLGSTEFIKWLLSPQNTAGFERINVESIPGKKRAVAFRMEQPMCFTLCRGTLGCEDEPAVFEPEDDEIVFDLTEDPFRHCSGEDNDESTVLQFDEETLMKYCKDDDTTWIKNKIFRYLLRFEEALNAALAAELEVEIGRNGKNEALTNLPIFTQFNQFAPNMAALNPEAFSYLRQLYSDMGLSGQFGLIGGSVVNKMADLKGWTTMNAAGIDMSKVDNLKPYIFYDRDFEGVYGEKDMVLLAPGATQLVTWNKYKGEKRRSITNLYTKSTVILPRTGLEVDYKWYYDYKCEKWTFEAFLHARLATVVKGGCGANLANVNGIIRIHDCSLIPIIPECPVAPEA